MEQSRPAPPELPPGAVWNPELDAWELAHHDRDGLRQGQCRLFRADGTLREICHYEADVRNGPFVVYHPSGEVARRGSFSLGAIDGALLAYASDGPTPEMLRDCCVPETAWELRARYAQGRPLREVFHDRQGRPLLSSGGLRPDLPASVPPDAELDETDQRWVHGQLDDAGNRVGRYQSWTISGRLAEVNEYDPAGRLVFAQRYDTDGADEDAGGEAARMLEECHFTDGDILHGDYRRRFTAAMNPNADPRVREERGAFNRGRPVGRWSFLDENGGPIATAELGLAVDEDHIADSPALAWRRPAAAAAPAPAAQAAGSEAAGSQAAGSDDWWNLASRLRDEGRVREALCAAARGGDAARLSAFVAEHTVALSPEVRDQRGSELSASSTQTLTTALDALVGGVDPAAVFRSLASVMDSAHPAALDFVNASLLLAPGRRMTYLTRALIRVEQGDDQGALADAAEVAVEAPDAARSLREHMRPTFPDFSFAGGFWPVRDADVLDGEIVAGDVAQSGPRVPVQTLQDVRRMVRVYATRLGRLRAMVQERTAPRVSDPVWLPPDLGQLLPDGPETLRRLTTTLPESEGETDGAEIQLLEIRVDEEQGLEVDERRSVADLLVVARGDWSALGWLCWACGLDRVALPDRIVPPTSFGAAVALSVARCYRAQDRMVTGGVRGRSQGLPSFTWEGIDVDEMPHHVARIAAAEYLEVRSMFLWLILPDALSPFQSDLRDA